MSVVTIDRYQSGSFRKSEHAYPRSTFGGKPLLRRVAGGYTTVAFPIANRDVPRTDIGYQIERLVANYQRVERKLIREASKPSPDRARLAKLAAILSETRARVGMLQDKAGVAP